MGARAGDGDQQQQHGGLDVLGPTATGNVLASAPARPRDTLFEQPASKIGHPSKGRIWLTVNGTEQQKGDLTELIWSVPEIIWQLSQQVKLAAGDIIMTGTPSGVAATVAGDKIECEVEGVGKLTVTIGPPLK